VQQFIVIILFSKVAFSSESMHQVWVCLTFFEFIFIPNLSPFILSRHETFRLFQFPALRVRLDHAAGTSGLA
jgi:hypothetical protein